MTPLTFLVLLLAQLGLVSTQELKVIPEPKNPKDATSCKDVASAVACRQWAGSDLTGCQSSPGYMALNCPKTCKMCHLRNAEARCGPLQNDNVAMRPGDLDRLFSNLTSTPVEEFDEDGSVSYSDSEFVWTGRNNRPYTIHKLSSSPWIVVIDNVLTGEESDQIIEIAHSVGFIASTTTGEVDVEGKINRRMDRDRTSSQAWCQGSCDTEPLINTLYDRISEITTVPADNFEHLQMLKYEETEFYAAHHDLLGLDPVISACGPRILTFFIYLSDVEEGGETNFPELNMAVVPKKGRAVLWANVLDKDLETQDNLTKHEAKPVIKGRKYGANSWIHLKNYREVNLWACSG